MEALGLDGGWRKTYQGGAIGLALGEHAREDGKVDGEDAEEGE